MKIAIIPPNEEHMTTDSAKIKWPLYNVLKGDTKHTWRIITEIKNWDEVDIFLFFNFYWGWSYKIYLEIYKKKMSDRVVYLMMEPEIVGGFRFHSKKGLPYILKYTDCVITWNKKLTNERNVFFSFFNGWKNRLEDYKDRHDEIPFSQKKLLCTIVGYKKANSAHPLELYSERLKIIDYFEKTHGDDFGLYGLGWPESKYKNYCGKTQSKGDVYARYRFALCLENIKGISGGVSEKIFDALIYGIVPIYSGDPDILSYGIPKESYIQHEDFKRVEDLYDYLKNISEEDYQQFLDSRNEFIRSKAYIPFTPEYWRSHVAEICEKKIKKGTDLFLGNSIYFFCG